MIRFGLASVIEWSHKTHERAAVNRGKLIRQDQITHPRPYRNESPFTTKAGQGQRAR